MQTPDPFEHPWFAVEDAGAGVWRIAEPGHVNAWLIPGSERSVLVDTGLGIAPIRPVAEALARGPLEVVNTHYHFDHVGGNHEFDGAAVHASGVEPLGRRFDPDQAAFFIERVQRTLRAAPPNDVLRPLPAGFDPARWSVGGAEATITLAEGDTLELGDSAWRVLHLPGHSPDGIGLLDEHRGVLLSGDAIDEEDNYMQFPDCDLHALRSTLLRLLELRSSIDLALLSHSAATLTELPWIEDVLEMTDEALAGATGTPIGEDIVGNPVRELRRGARSLVLSDPDTPARPLVLAG